MTKPLIDRSIAVVSKKEVRTDLALKYAKQELAGESGMSSSQIIPPNEIGGRPALPPLIHEIVTSQTKGHSPIIIVPSASNSRSRLTCLNIIKFLREGVYEEPNARSMTRPDMPLEFEKIVYGKPLRFRVFDEVSTFRKADWSAVVAVFTDGKMWQFSGWPFKTESDLFNTFQIFNLRYSDDASEPLVSSGRVRSLIVRRAARHQDSAVMIEFWKALETFLNQPRTKRFSNSGKLP